MNAQQLFEIWAPAESVWSRWAKPALFAEGGVLAPAPITDDAPQSSFRAGGDSATAFVLDLPGVRSVELGLALARAGYRPVPLFNTADHPAAVVKVRPVLQAMMAGAEDLRQAPLAPGSPPAFLLDANRSAAVLPTPGTFDNRWVVFPQDFPSANFLRSQGVLRVVLLQEARQGPQPQWDLSHVLRRWQEAGIEIYRQDPAADEPPRPMTVERPSRFRNIAYRALALIGLRRNSAGGFGSIIPMASAGTGFS